MNEGTAGPTTPAERIAFLDLVRGTALFGILVVNLPLMNTPYESQIGPLTWWPGTADRIAHGFIRFFFEGSFYVLFSALFAQGAHRLLSHEDAGEPGVRRRYLRRLAGLAVLGGLHLTFLWYGDVLLLYAVAGLLLLAFRRRQERTLMIWVGVLLVIPLVALAVLVVGFTLVDQVEFSTSLEGQLRPLFEWLVTQYRSPELGEVRAARWYEIKTAFAGLWMFFPQLLAAMLLGFVLARRRILTEPDQQGAFFRTALIVALPIAVVGKLAHAWSSHHASFGLDWGAWWGVLGFVAGGPALAFVYLALLRRLHLSGRVPALQAGLVATGRMALSNYLFQSLVATSLFYGYGMGWYGRVSIWQGLLLAGALYVCQVGLSVLWLRRFRFGPLEALLRAWIYGRGRL